MKKTLLFLTLLTTGMLFQLNAQNRYLDEVFTSYTVAPIIYDTNIWVPPFSGTQNLGPRPQTGAVYMPVGDTLTARPVIIYMHTGSFLPAITNGQPTGNINDSTAVEMCRRFAKRGFVAIAINYRLGWNPQTTDANVATGQLLNATYRAVQDAKSAIRFARINASTLGIDTSRIILGGQGTGGYASLAAATLNKYSEITLGKFIYNNQADPSDPQNGKPHVDTSLSGDWNGIGGSIMNLQNTPSVPCNFHFEFNLGGAMGDSLWLEQGEIPMVGFHCVDDPFAPYERGNVIVPTTQAVVISNASGSKVVMDKVARLGNNAAIEAKIIDDVWTTRGLASSNGTKDLYTFRFSQFPLQSAPWEWWNRDSIRMTPQGRYADSVSTLTNPDMSEAKAKAYIDTIQGFLVPRIVIALGLPGKELFGNTGVKELTSLTSQLSLYPNPAKEELNIQLPVAIKSVSIVDMMGREVLTHDAKSMNVKMDISSLKQGLYFLTVKSTDGRSAVKRIVVN